MPTADLRTPIHDVLSGIETWLGTVTTLEWVLLGIALGIVLWIVAAVRAAARLGSIEIDTIEWGGPKPADGGDGDLVARTSLLRERLAHIGLRPPPWVPAGAPASADLVSAIEKSPVPEANWIATLINAIPRPQPVSYKLTTTLLPDEPAVRIWLRPGGAGTPLLETVRGGLGAALRRVPELVFVHVNVDAVGVFPGWARWDTTEGLRAYTEGLDAMERQDDRAAIAAFERAEAAQPGNALVRLRQLNIREALVAEEGERIRQAEELTAEGEERPPPTAPDEAFQHRAAVLREYADLATWRPELVEARYRASTMGSALADAFGTLTGDEQEAVVSSVSWTGSSSANDVVAKLRALSERQLEQALLLLEPWSVWLLWRRPRYAPEPNGPERRALKRTLEISKRIQLARRLNGDNWREKLRLRSAGLFVRFTVGRVTADWQAEYNAGCFYALRGNRDLAYRYLERAISATTNPRLVVWLREGDPDLAKVRDVTDSDWRRLAYGSHEWTSLRVPPLPRDLLEGIAVVALALVLVIAVLLVPALAVIAFAFAVVWQVIRVGRYLFAQA